MVSDGTAFSSQTQSRRQAQPAASVRMKDEAAAADREEVEASLWLLLEIVGQRLGCWRRQNLCQQAVGDAAAASSSITETGGHLTAAEL
jgi:hypothetical protein